MFGSCKPVEPSRQLAFIDLVAADVSLLILHYGLFPIRPSIRSPFWTSRFASRS